MASEMDSSLEVCAFERARATRYANEDQALVTYCNSRGLLSSPYLSVSDLRRRCEFIHDHGEAQVSKFPCILSLAYYDRQG